MNQEYMRTWIFCALVVSSRALFAAGPPEDNESLVRKMSPAAHEASRSNVVFGIKLCEMVQTTNTYGGLSALIAACKNDVALRTNSAILVALVDGIRSRTPAVLADSESVEVPSRVKSGKMQRRPGAKMIRQDIFLRGGRAAWFLEVVLNCELPELTEQSTDEEVEDVVLEAYYRLKEAALPPGSLRTVEGLTEEEKRKLAEASDSNAVVFYRLAMDAQSSIRRVVAANRKAPVHVLSKLARDKNPEVKRLALENLKMARTSSE